jgi:hypothetical protein
MTDAKTAPTAATSGFSTRWMLDRTTPPTTTVAGDAAASANAIDTDGDGIADTLAVRVDTAPHRRSALRSIGTWIARSCITFLLVAALVVAGAASAALLQTRDDLEVARAQVRDERDATREARAELDAATTKVDHLQQDAASASASSKDVADERDELQLEVKVLRHMLVESDATR